MVQEWLPCTCHLLNLWAQDLFEGKIGDNTISQLVSKIRRFVTSFRHSGLLQKALKDKQIAVNAPVKIKLVQDVNTLAGTQSMTCFIQSLSIEQHLKV